MPFEFSFRPIGVPEFPAAALEAMHEFLRRLPHHQWPDGSYTIFASAADRERQLPYLLTARTNSYTDSAVAVKPADVMLSVAGFPETDRMLRDFVVWSKERWPSALFAYDREVSPDALLPREA